MDPHRQIKITSADHYETQGRLPVKYTGTTVNPETLESSRYIIPERDKSGGSGASFIAEWTADTFVNLLIVKSVMMGRQGASFTSRGRVIIASEQ
ncbi:MAG: DUF3124 domain-containing protein [Candidatus Zixiibacteriota bacterium]|nr:MAG: DUF3124 domain-containing protein [candidate division Zixibacteria bacterium]